MNQENSNTQNGIVAQQGANWAPVVHDESEFANLLDSNRFDHLWKAANVFSRSKLVPDIFQNDQPSCFVAMQMAIRLQVDPMMFMQKSYIVHGRPGIEATLAIALANKRGPFTGPIQWKFEGKGEARACTAFATHKETGETCEITIDWKTVVAEGWLSKSGSKWKTMPDMMFRYRTAMWLIRAYCPEVILGLQSVEEVIDSAEPIDITPNARGTYEAAAFAPPVNATDLMAELLEHFADEEDHPDVIEFIETSAAAAKADKSKVVAKALENPEGFAMAFAQWQAKNAPKADEPVSLGDRLAARAEQEMAEQGERATRSAKAEEPPLSFKAQACELLETHAKKLGLSENDMVNTVRAAVMDHLTEDEAKQMCRELVAGRQGWINRAIDRANGANDKGGE